MKRRILSILTALALVLSLCPAWAVAAEGGAETGSDTTEEQEPDVSFCSHGEPVGGCRICPIEEKIAVLPEQVTENNRSDVRARLDEILTLFSELTENEQEKADLSRCYVLQGALDAANTPAATEGEPQTIYLSNAGNDTNSGANKENPVKTLQKAVELAGEGGKIIVCGSSWIWVKPSAPDGAELNIKNITIERDAECKASPLFWLEQQAKYNTADKTWTHTPITVTLENTVVDGKAPDQKVSGYTLFYVKNGAELVLKDGAVLQNSTCAAYLDKPNPVVEDVITPTLRMEQGSMICNNTANLTCIQVQTGSAFIMNGGIVTGNTSKNGAAIYSTGGSVSINGGEITGNQGYAGAIYNWGGTVTIEGGKIHGNTGTSGGCIYNDKSTSANNTSKIVIKDGEFSDNQYNNYGLIYNVGGNLEISGGTFQGKTGGLYSEFVSNGGTVKLSGSPVFESIAFETNVPAVTVASDFVFPKAIDVKVLYVNPLEGLTVATYENSDPNARDFYCVSNGYTTTTQGSGVILTAGFLVTLSRDGEKEYQIVKPGEKAVKPAVGVPPGHMLTWYTNEDFTDEFDFDSQVKKDVNLYANLWKCEHTGSMNCESNHNGTHNELCSICGLSIGAKPCSYEFENHTATCTSCGSEISISFDDTALTYNGTAQRPDVTVTVDDQTLTQGYTVAYSNNTNAGTASITVEGTNFQGTDTQAFIISPKTVTAGSSNITLTPGAYEFDGTECKPTVVIQDGDLTIPASEYEVSYSGNINVGTATVTITDKDGGNYTVSGATTFTIAKAGQTPLTITGAPASVTYGDTFQLGVSGGSGTGAVSWAASGATVDNTGNVTITAAGPVIITATKAGDSNYTGTEAQITLNAAKKELTPSITGTTTKTYDGTTNCDGTGLSITLDGLLGGDSSKVTATAESYTYDTANAEENKLITATGITLDGEGKDNYILSGTTAAANVGTIAKSQPTIVWAEGFSLDKTYDGQTIPNPVADDLTVTGAEFSDVTFTWSATPLNAGTYTLTAIIAATANTEAAQAGPLTVTISPKPVSSPVIELSPDSFVYDGAEKKPAVTVKDGDTVIPSGEYTVTYGDNTNAGTATATITGKDGGNYMIAQTAETFTITTANQAPLAITGAPASVTYGDTFQLGFSGGSGAGAVSWAASGATVDNTGKATITGAGTVIITVTKAGDSNYTGTEAQITLNAGKKALTVTGAEAQDRQYNGANTVTVTAVTLDGVVDGDAVSVDTAALTGTISGTDAGDYTAVTLPVLTLTGAAKDNYTLTRPAGAVSTDVTIGKAAPLTPKTGGLAVANGRAHTYTFGLGALRPEVPGGMSLGSSAVAYTLDAVSLGSYYTGGAEIQGQTLTLPIQAVDSSEAGGIGTVTVTIHTGNFQDMTAAIHVRSVNKIVPTGGPALSADTLTYGQALGAITLSGTMRDGETDVPGAFAWSSPDNRPAVQETYSAAWTFTPADNDKYAIVNGTSAIQVVPASVAGADVTLSQTAFRYDGQPHSPGVTGVRLGDTALTADVDYTAGIPQGTDAGTYTVTLTGKGNYTGTATATFTINPVETGDEFEDESGTLLRLEVETGLSTVPAGLENDARYDTPEKIETALRTQVEQVMSNVGENIAVFDVTLQYRDESGTWHTVDPDDFPAEGVTAILPYPDGTGATGYTFTVQHLISSGAQAGTMETLSYTLTADGLQCQFSSLSPVAIGYQAAAKPVDPVEPNPGGSSGGGGAGTYAVTVEKPEHGKVTSSRTNAGSGSTVTLTVTPDRGYVLDTLTATDSRGSELRLTARGDGTYTFTMPGRAVTVKAAFVPLPGGTACDGGVSCPSRSFTDLGMVGTWYHEAVDYVLRNHLMYGYGDGTFRPNDTLSRAQLTQLLYNKEGRPAVAGGSAFTDVADGAWYAPAVIWAAGQGIVDGYGNGLFGPGDNITREQLAVMLWRYAGNPAATEKELHFTDADKASAYALEALRWAVENGFMGGCGDGQLDPGGPATRAQVAQMLKNFMENPHTACAVPR